MKVGRVGLLSALIYTGTALTFSVIFLAATLRGEYSWVTRLGGAGWVFLLSMIVLMPQVTSFIKRKYAAH